MNLIELVEQARAVVRVWENGRLVDVVLVRYPVRYPEMLTCSSELAYTRSAETTPEVCTMKPEPLPFQAAPFSGQASVIGLSNLHPATRKGAS